MSPSPGARDHVEQHFAEAVSALQPGQPDEPGLAASVIAEGSQLTAARCLELFDAQLASRHLDLAARWLRARGAGYYTIGSSGHEGNAAVAAALRLTDPALLHYRSGAFYLVRAGAGQPARDGVTDVLLGLVAAAAEPIAGGRHKVFGHPELHVIPQTSTIASHLPRAVGLAFALARAAKLGLRRRGRRTRSWSAASATPRRITRPRPARSTPLPTAPTRACRCRCCWSARTTASASASGRRPAG